MLLFFPLYAPPFFLYCNAICVTGQSVILNICEHGLAQRSIANWISFEHMSDIGYYFTYGQQGATTVTDAEKLWEKSPLRYAPNCTTPTLFIGAENDYCCPIAESYSMFTALKKAGCESKMVIFHGESHGLSTSGKPRNRIRLMEEILGWMDKYLKLEQL